MKPNSENHKPLSRVMHEWRVTESLPPRFQEGVWRRIQQTEAGANPVPTTTLWSMCKAWLATALPRPAFAAAYLSILLVAGMAAGYWRAQQTTSHLNDELGTRYVQSVDPYQKPSRMGPRTAAVAVAQPQQAGKERRAPKLEAPRHRQLLRLVFDTAAVRL